MQPEREPSAASIQPMISLQELGLQFSSTPTTPDAFPDQPMPGLVDPAGTQGLYEGSPHLLLPSRSLQRQSSSFSQPAEAAFEAAAGSAAPDGRHLLQPEQALHWLSPEPSAQSVSPMPEQLQDPQQQTDEPHKEQDDELELPVCEGSLAEASNPGSPSKCASSSQLQHLLQPGQALHWLSPEASAVSVLPGEGTPPCAPELTAAAAAAADEYSLSDAAADDGEVRDKAASSAAAGRPHLAPMDARITLLHACT